MTMSVELDRVLATAEDFLRRSIPSRPAREAQKRRAQRKLREVLRRLRRAALLLAAMLAGLVAWSILVAPIGFLTWLVAVPTAFLLAFLSLFWGRSRPAEPHAPAAAAASVPLEQVAARAEEALIDRYGELPGRALPAADRVIARLNELQPHLDALDAQGMLAGDARRLICDHLPRLVDSWLGLPDAARAPGSEDSRRFAESLAVVADEFDHLFEQCCREKHLSFETQHRFIETRYKQDRRLAGE
jgi:hypothetical protein